MELRDGNKCIDFDENGELLTIRGYSNKIDGTYRRCELKHIVHAQFNDEKHNMRILAHVCPSCASVLPVTDFVYYCPFCGTRLTW